MLSQSVASKSKDCLLCIYSRQTMDWSIKLSYYSWSKRFRSITFPYWLPLSQINKPWYTQWFSTEISFLQIVYKETLQLLSAFFFNNNIIVYLDTYLDEASFKGFYMARRKLSCVQWQFYFEVVGIGLWLRELNSIENSSTIQSQILGSKRDKLITQSSIGY